MKTKISYSLLAAAMACGLAQAQTAYTTPVGYVSLGNTAAATPNLPANTDIFISVPLERASEWAGTVVSVDAVNSIITLNTTPDFVVNQWLPSTTVDPSTLDPFIFKVEGVIPSTPNSGFIAQITANDANTVTVTVPPGDSLAGIAAGNKVSIRRALTPRYLATGNVFPSGVQILLYDGVSGTEPSLSGQYTYDSATNKWTDEFFGGDAVTNAVLFPNELLILRNPTLTDIADVVVAGSVPSSSYRSVLSVVDGSVGQDIPLSTFSPVGELVVDANLPNLTTGDQILVFDNTATGIEKSISGQFTYNSTTGEWTDEFFGGDASAFLTFDGGSSYFLRKPAATAVTGDVIWNNTPNFVPSL